MTAKRKSKIHIALSLILLTGIIFSPAMSRAASDDTSLNDLQDQIDAKNQELQGINSQIQETQSQITTLQKQGESLSSAIKSLNYQIDQVTYGIRSSEVNIEKLSLELESLGFTLDDVVNEIGTKKVAVSKLLRELQQTDNESLLEVLLKNNTLADGVLEVQSLRDLQDNLSVSVAELNSLHDQLTDNIAETNSKKGDLEEENLNLKSRKSILSDQQGEKDTLLKQTKNEESVYQQQLTELRTQQQAILDEISSIEDELKARFDPNSVPSARSGLFSWPVVLKTDGGIGIITQRYGETAYSTAYYHGKPHNGLDIGAPIGTPVYAAADGTIVRVDYNGWYYQYGRYIMIDHGNNLSTLYAHLSKAIVTSGQSVSRGQLIGYVGETGFATGPHLHFGVYATPIGGWHEVTSREQAGFISIPPASGLVPIGVTLNPQSYL